MSPAIDRMERLGCQRLTPEGLQPFLASDRVVLLLTGDPARVREANDAAVIFPDLVRTLTDSLGTPVRAGFLTPDQENETVRAELGILAYPSVVAYRAGRFVGVVPGMKAWSDYVSLLSGFLSDGPSVSDEAARRA